MPIATRILPSAYYDSVTLMLVAKELLALPGMRDAAVVMGTPANLEGKTLITSAIDDERMAFFKKCKVNLVVDVSPKLFERVVGINVIEAMILATLETPQDLAPMD